MLAGTAGIGTEVDSDRWVTARAGLRVAVPEVVKAAMVTRAAPMTNHPLAST